METSTPINRDDVEIAREQRLLRSVRFSRRHLLVRAMAAGMALPAVGLLAACGGSSSTPTVASTGGGASSSTSTSTSATGGSTSSSGAASTGSGPASTAAASSPAASSTAANANIPKGGKLIYGLSREPVRLDPTQDTFAPSQMIHFSIHDCLVARAPDNAYYPWLADKWQVSSDGLSYTFNLKSGVKFHDGTPFNAASVKYMLDRVHDPNAKIALSGVAYGFYQTVDTPSDQTAVIKLSKPFAPMLDALSYLYRIVSPTAGQKWGDALAQHPVGTGPFMFKEWVPNDHVTLLKNPDYNWASPMFQHQGPAYLDEVTFRQIPEPSSRVAALESNEVQIIEVLPPQEVSRKKSDSKYEVLASASPGRPYGYSVNLRKPPTDDLNVRQAMEFAIDQEAIVNVVFGPLQSYGAFLPQHNCLTPNTWGYDPKAAALYKHDPAKATQLLESSGWTMGPNGIRQKNGQPLQIKMATWESAGVEEVIQQQYRAVGIDWNIQVVAGITANELARREEVHMSPLPAARSDPNLLSTNHSRNRPNGNDFTYQTNKHFDDLIDSAAAATNDDDRLKMYSEIQQIIMGDVWYVPVYGYDNVSARRSELKGKIIFDRGIFPYIYDLYLSK